MKCNDLNAFIMACACQDAKKPKFNAKIPNKGTLTLSAKHSMLHSMFLCFGKKILIAFDCNCMQTKNSIGENIWSMTQTSPNDENQSITNITPLVLLLSPSPSAFLPMDEGGTFLAVGRDRSADTPALSLPQSTSPMMRSKDLTSPFTVIMSSCIRLLSSRKYQILDLVLKGGIHSVGGGFHVMMIVL